MFGKNKNVTLMGKFSFIARFLLVSVAIMTVSFSAYSAFLYILGANANTENFNAVLKRNLETSMEASFSKMASLRDAADEFLQGALTGAEGGASKASLQNMLNNYALSQGSECAVLRPGGEVFVSSSNFFEKSVETMTVSTRREFTVKIPTQGNGGGSRPVVPVFLPLHKSEGFLYVLWRPGVVAEKVVPWVGNALYSSDGTLLDSNVPGLLPKISSSALSGGKVGTEAGKGVSSLITLPDGETVWWNLMVTEERETLTQAIKGIVPMAGGALLFFLFIFIPFRKLKKEVLEDLIFIRDLIAGFYARGKVDVQIMRRARSHEVRQLGKMFLQISEQINSDMSTLKNQSGSDLLTGLPNRSSMEKELNSRIEREECFSILFLDLDGFKPINDNLGHDVGDLVLKAVARKVLESFRDKDYVCRWGGDEFVVCAHGNVEPVLDKLFARIRGKLAEINVNNIAGRDDLPPYRVGTSIGVSAYPTDGVTVESLIQQADERMYEDKVNRKSGR